MRPIISMVSISLEGFMPSILLLVVIIVAVVIVAVILVVVVIDAIVVVVIVVASIGVVVIVDDGVYHIIKLLFVIIVTFPSMIWGSPLMKASIIFSVFGTMFGHKMANSWNLLTPDDPIGLFYSDRLSVCIPPRQGIIGQANKSNNSFRTIEVERLTVNELFVVSSFYYRNFSWSSVPIGIVGICIGSNLCFQGCSNTLCNQFPDGSLGHSWVQRKEFKTSRDIHGNNGMSDLIGGLDTKIHQSVVDLTGDEDPSDEDGGTGMVDSTGVSVSLGKISLEGNKSWELTLVIVIILEMEAK
uniref:Uncharacterized protein n=1 Tax=Tanacetum cinerariifolium TaxID=118510 RepID=A0A6L2JYF9_TANCI|nr:hypothetical protein [Tanacetum cinerariifolium]